MNQITVGNTRVDIIRKYIKNMHLAVYPPSGRVRLAVPNWVKDEAIRLFVISKLAWIKRQQRRFRSQERQSRRQYKYRESHYYFGRRYLLNVTEHDAPPQVVLKNKAIIDLCVRKGTTVQKRHVVMNEWYRKELKKLIPSLIEKWEKRTGLRVKEWGVKQMKTKWGSCNPTAKRIWINLELAKKPVRCLEYIIVHEIVHLVERHHNELFIAYMDEFMPQWKAYRKELNSFPLSNAEWSY